MMETQIKQRLVGGVVIVCVLAIFLPILLHKPKTDQAQSIPMAIPKPMTVSQMSLQLPSATDKFAAAEKIVTQPPVKVSQPPRATAQVAVKKPMAPVVDHSINNKILQSAISTPQAWVVQLGSFSLKNNAEKLVQRLRKQGFDAYSRSNDENHHLITRVFVGPEINRGTMQHINKKLQHDFHLKGVVRKYNV